MTIPKTMKAQVLQASKTIKVEEVPVPAVEDDQILVRVTAVALNPTDWKHIEYLTVPGTICGCEFAGNVVQVGKGVTKFSVGDLVAGLTHGSAYTDKGAFAEYATVFEDLAWKVPDNVTAEEAATMNVGPLTVLQSLYHPTALAIPTLPAKIEQEQWILIYGGSSSVGLFAIQLAKLSGFKVVTTASPRNFDLLKSLGADALFDYRDPEVISKIKAATNDSIHLALDCISTPSSETLTLQTFAPGPGKLHVLTFLQSEDIRQIRSDVSISVSLLYTANGIAFTIAGHHIPASPENRKQVADWLAGPWVPLVRDGLVKPNPVKLMSGGLEGIAVGLEYVKAGKNSAEKVVYRI